jgi:hypothetical protein
MTSDRHRRLTNPSEPEPKQASKRVTSPPSGFAAARAARGGPFAGGAEPRGYGGSRICSFRGTSGNNITTDLGGSGPSPLRVLTGQEHIRECSV